MKTRSIIAALAVITVTAGGAGLAQANNFHGYHKNYSERQYGDCSEYSRHKADNYPYGENYGWQGKSFTDEQIAQIEDMRAEHFDAMQRLGNDFRQKKRELNALKYNPNTDPKELQKILSDMNSIENKMDSERQNFVENMKKEFGIEMYGEYGMHHGKTGKHGYNR